MMCRHVFKVTKISIKEGSTKQRKSVLEHEFCEGKLSFMSEEAVEEIEHTPTLGLCMKRFKGDLQTVGLDYMDLSVEDELIIGGIRAKVTQVGKPCHAEACAAFDESKPCIMTVGTMFASVTEAGKVCVGDLIEVKN